jgi:Major Facilitator Superfamily
VSVPIGVFGTIWAYLKLRDTGIRRPARLDWWGNILFAVGLIGVLVGITYGIQPYHGHTMGWSNPWVTAAMAGGVAVLVVFCVVETRVPDPMFHLDLFRIRAFTAGNLASLLSSLGHGGLQFILIIWLQGIWLPRHGYSFTETPLWAGIYMLPVTVGFLAAGPISGHLSDRFGPRRFAVGGMLFTAATFGLLIVLPINFVYWQFALLLLANGIGMGPFAAPNRAQIMNSLPANQRGVGAGISATFQNSAMVLHRDLLQPDHPRPVPLAAGGALRRPGRPGRTGLGRGPARGAAAGRRALRVAARLQPGPDAARSGRTPATAGRSGKLPDRALVLPVADLRPVRERFAGGVLVRDRGVPAGRGGLVAAPASPSASSVHVGGLAPAIPRD